MAGDRLFLGTLDAHLLAIDARTGKLVWDTTVADFADPACRPPNVKQAACYVITHAPLVVKDKILVGTGGGDGGILTTGSNLLFVGVTGDNNSGPSASRQIDGYFYALDARTGVQLWRTSLAASVHGSPISYVAGGTQYVAVSAGNSLFGFARRRP